ncbi:MAG: hypothetical protein QNJ16_07935 [Rhodobacter sp.]|nr:hypothetical protein [Rhodobacter sp.]
MPDELQRRGWVRFEHDTELAAWVTAAGPAAHRAVADPANSDWLRCRSTWFAGVNVLPNDATGAVAGSGPLRGAAVDAIRRLGLPADRWDRGQVSVIYPGYPQPRAGEPEAAFRFRRDRDAAHVDGLLPVGPLRRRLLREPHAFVLGLPVTEAGPGASPMVVWEGSHEVMRQAFRTALSGRPAEDWPQVDLTDAYHAARRHVFENCKRTVVHARPGEAYLVHRLALHGVSPWQPGAAAPEAGRMIVYFRPELSGPITDWLARP